MYEILINYSNQLGGKNKHKHKNKYEYKKSGNELYDAGIKYKTDKLTHHGYHRFYNFLLKPYKNQDVKLLEVGIDDGRSLQMWRDYFNDNSKIYGLDLKNAQKDFDRKNIYELTGDQSKTDDLDNITKKIGKCDIIIDDGSHVPEHQLFSFNYLFNHLLKEGGIYIIEDIETSYWSNSELYGYKIDSGLDSKNSIINIFKQVVDVVNAGFIHEEDVKKIKNESKIDNENLHYISFIVFAHNCVIVNKMTEEEHTKYYKKEYRFKQHILKKYGN